MKPRYLKACCLADLRIEPMMIVLLILGFMNDMDVKSEAGVNHSKIIEMNQAASLRLRLIRISNYHESAPLVYRWIMLPRPRNISSEAKLCRN